MRIFIAYKKQGFMDAKKQYSIEDLKKAFEAGQSEYYPTFEDWQTCFCVYPPVIEPRPHTRIAPPHV